MKVAIVQEFVDARRGGAETSTIEMAAALARLGLSVTVFHRAASNAEAPLPAAPAPYAQGGVNFWPLAAGGRTRVGQTYRYVQAVQRLCRLERFDIVHAVLPCLVADVYQPRGGTYAETVARTLAVTRSPVVRLFKRLGRLFNVRQRFLMRLERTLLTKRADRVTVAALSDYVRRQVLALGLPPERVRVVFNGVDVAPLAPEERMRLRATQRERLGISPQTPFVLFVAHNFRLKGLRELLHACATEPLRSRPDLQLIVAGRDDAAPYQRLARRLGLAARVHFLGGATPVAALYATADVLAHPTWYDPCSRVVLEALATGLPVVTTRYNGAAELITPGRHGYVVAEPADRTALAEAIAGALDPALAAACRADAAALRQRVAMTRHASELRRLYEDVLAARR